MSIGDDSLKKENLKAEKLRKVSSPGKLTNKSDKPSGVDPVAQADTGNPGETYNEAVVQSIADLANANKAKLNELIAALKG